MAGNQVLCQMAFSCSLPFLPFYVRELGVADPREALLWAGAAGSATAVGLAVLSPMWGLLADRFGRKLMLLRVAMGGALVLGAMGLVTNVVQLFFLRLAQGAITGSLAAGAALAAAASPPQRAGRNLGLVQSAVQTGNVLGPLLGGLLVAPIGYRGLFLASGGLLLAAGLVITTFAREPFRPSVSSAMGGAPRGLSFVLRTPHLGRLLALIVGVQFSIGAVFAPLPLLIEDLRTPDQPSAQLLAGVALGLTAVVGALSAPWVGRRVDALGPGRVLSLSLLLGAGLLAAQAAAGAIWQLLALQALVGLSSVGQLASIGVLTKRLLPAGREGVAFGVAAAAQSVGFGLGPIGGSAIAAQLGLRAVFLAAGLVLAGLTLLARAESATEPGPAELPAG